MNTTESQPREHPVPCLLCGITSRRQPRTLTWNKSALCDLHERPAPR